jgi:hypothetical protein
MAETIDQITSFIENTGTAENEINLDISQLSESKFKDMVLEYDKMILSPIEFIVTACLASISGAAGKNYKYVMPNKLPIFLNIWAIIMGTSSTMKKSTTLTKCSAPLYEINKQLHQNFKSELAAYESLSEEEKGEVEKPIRDYLIIPSDITVERLSDVLSQSRHGIMIQNEFMTLSDMMNRSYSNGLKSFLTDIYDVPVSHEISRKSSDTLVVHPYLSILAATTPDWFREGINKNDINSGFLPRFIFSIKYSNNKKYLSLLEDEYFEIDEDQFTNRYQLILNNSGVFTIEDEAKEVFKTFDYQIQIENEKTNDKQKPIFNDRLKIYCLKIAGLLALWNNELGEELNVNESNMADAVVLTKYYQENAHRLIEKEIQYNTLLSKEDRIITIIEDFGEEFKNTKKITRSKLSNHARLAGGKKELDMLLESLEDKNKIELAEEKTSTKPKQFIILISDLE